MRLIIDCSPDLTSLCFLLPTVVSVPFAKSIFTYKYQELIIKMPSFFCFVGFYCAALLSLIGPFKPLVTKFSCFKKFRKKLQRFSTFFHPTFQLAIEKAGKQLWLLTLAFFFFQENFVKVTFPLYAPWCLKRFQDIILETAPSWILDFQQNVQQQ